jgi:hypothetical protein
LQQQQQQQQQKQQQQQQSFIIDGSNTPYTRFVELLLADTESKHSH